MHSMNRRVSCKLLVQDVQDYDQEINLKFLPCVCQHFMCTGRLLAGSDSQGCDRWCLNAASCGNVLQYRRQPWHTVCSSQKAGGLIAGCLLTCLRCSVEVQRSRLLNSPVCQLDMSPTARPV